jgi:hypothetical protein
MNQKIRIILAVVILVSIVGVMLGVDALQRKNALEAIPAGSIPIYVDGDFIASFVPEDLDQLEMVSFVDMEEGKTQEGWMLVDVIWLYVEDDLNPESDIIVSSSSRDKSITLSFSQIDNQNNMVMFDLSGRGTLKLVSSMPGFDTRDDWIQDVDKIEMRNP